MTFFYCHLPILLHRWPRLAALALPCLCCSQRTTWCEVLGGRRCGTNSTSCLVKKPGPAVGARDLEIQESTSSLFETISIYPNIPHDVGGLDTWNGGIWVSKSLPDTERNNLDLMFRSLNDFVLGPSAKPIKRYWLWIQSGVRPSKLVISNLIIWSPAILRNGTVFNTISKRDPLPLVYPATLEWLYEVIRTQYFVRYWILENPIVQNWENSPLIVAFFWVWSPGVSHFAPPEKLSSLLPGWCLSNLAGGFWAAGSYRVYIYIYVIIYIYIYTHILTLILCVFISIYIYYICICMLQWTHKLSCEPR